MMSYQWPSLLIAKTAVGQELVLRGHEVFMAVSEGYTKSESIRKVGIQIINYKEPENALYPHKPEFEDRLLDFIFVSPEGEYNIYFDSANDDCHAMLNDRSFMDRVKSMNFDLAVVEPLYLNPCYLLFPRLFGLPYASITALALPVYIGLPVLPSFYVTPAVDSSKTLPSVRDLSGLSGRLANSWAMTMFSFYVAPKFWGNTTLLDIHVPGVGSWQKLLMESEIILLENDHQLDSALPLLPHVVTAAGTTASPPEPLPKRLEDVVNKSGESGVILVSFGSLTHRLPRSIIDKFFEGFSRLKETVVMRLVVANDTEVGTKLKNITN